MMGVPTLMISRSASHSSFTEHDVSFGIGLHG